MALGLGGLTNLKDLATKAVDKYKLDNQAPAPAPLAKTASGIGSGPLSPMPTLSTQPSILNPGPGTYIQTGNTALNQATTPSMPSVLDHMAGTDLSTAMPNLGPQTLTAPGTGIAPNADVATAMPTQPISYVENAAPKNTDVATAMPTQPISYVQPSAPKNTDVATPMPLSSTPPSTGTPPAAPTSKAGDLYNSVLDQLSSGIKDSKPLAGTQAQITQSREALAQYAKSAEARAGMAAAKSDSLGQGTANAMGQETRQDVLGHLANSELANTQLVSNEKQALIDKATQVGQFDKTQGMEQQRIDIQKDQFKQTLDTNKDQFEKTFGSNEASLYRNQLERLGQDNPVLATKLTNYLLAGKTGAVGDFTPEEMQQMKDYTAKKTGQDDQVQAVMTKILAAVPGQIASSTQAQTDADAKAAKDKALAEAKDILATGKTLTPEQTNALVASGDIPTVSKFTDGSAAKAYMGKTVSMGGGLTGQVVNIGQDALTGSDVVNVKVGDVTVGYYTQDGTYRVAKNGRLSTFSTAQEAIDYMKAK